MQGQGYSLMCGHGANPLVWVKQSCPGHVIACDGLAATFSNNVSYETLHTLFATQKCTGNSLKYKTAYEIQI